MCIEDVRIAMSTMSYPRPVTLAGASLQALPANPKRWGLILPSVFTNIIAWSLGNDVGSTGGSAQWLTGSQSGPSAVNDIAFMPVVLNINTLGDIIRGPLFAFNRAGPGVTVTVIETVFVEETYRLLWGGK